MSELEGMMTNYHLGERYPSEDMYHGPYLRPGDKIAIERGGVPHASTIQSVHYTSGTPAVWPSLTRWQRLRRSITPARFRKPLEPISHAKGPEVTISTGKSPVEATERKLRDMQRHMDAVLRAWGRR